MPLRRRQSSSFFIPFPEATQPPKENRIAAALRNLVGAYERINRAAEAGKPVGAVDFKKAENTFAAEMNAASQNPIAAVEQEARMISPYHAGLDPRPIEAAFAKNYVARAAQPDNSLPRDMDGEKQLIAELLKKNPGFFLGDVHTQEEAFHFLARNMKTLKDSGVDTIYVENTAPYQRMAALKMDELKTLARDGQYKDIYLRTPQQMAQHFGMARSDDSDQAFVKFLIAAKEHKVRLVNMEQKEQVANHAEFLLSFGHRIASTNFIWTEAVKNDRQALGEKGKSGKYVAVGGLAHVISDGRNNGMVDEALGLPLVAFEKDARNRYPMVRPMKNPNGADFYLPGGHDHDDTMSWVLDAAENPVAQMMRSNQVLDPVPMPPAPPQTPSFTPVSPRGGFFRRRGR